MGQNARQPSLIECYSPLAQSALTQNLAVVSHGTAIKILGLRTACLGCLAMIHKYWLATNTEPYRQ